MAGLISFLMKTKVIRFHLIISSAQEVFVLLNLTTARQWPANAHRVATLSAKDNKIGIDRKVVLGVWWFVQWMLHKPIAR